MVEKSSVSDPFIRLPPAHERGISFTRQIKPAMERVVKQEIRNSINFFFQGGESGGCAERADECCFRAQTSIPGSKDDL